MPAFAGVPRSKRRPRGRDGFPADFAGRDRLRERSLAAESYLRLGYMDRALTELEQALQESPTSVSTRLNYARIIPMVDHTAKVIGRLLA